MKMSINFLAIFIVIVVLSTTVIAQYSNSNGTIGESVIINAISIRNTTFYDPYPAEPGSYINLLVRAQYLGTISSAEDVFCGVSPTFPFTTEPGDVSVINIGSLQAYEEITLKYRIRIDANAIQGENQLKFGCRLKDFDWAYTDLPIFIQAQDAIISIESIISSPSEFSPGESGVVKIVIKNIGPVLLKDISVKLDLSSETLPFAPIESTTEKRISSLESGQSLDVEFNVVSDPNAAVGLYKLPIELRYRDSLNKNYSKDALTSLSIRTLPEVFIVHEQIEIIRNGTKNSVTASIVNRGLSKIKFMTATLGDSENGDYVLLSPESVYVGDINSDDSETAQFDLFINTTKQSILIPLSVEFKDESGNNYTVSEMISVRVFTDEEAIRYGFENAVTTDPLLLGVVAIIGTYVLYRIYRFATKRKSPKL